MSPKFKALSYNSFKEFVSKCHIAAFFWGGGVYTYLVFWSSTMLTLNALKPSIMKIEFLTTTLHIREI